MKTTCKGKLADDVVNVLVAINHAPGTVRGRMELHHFISGTLKDLMEFQDVADI